MLRFRNLVRSRRRRLGLALMIGGVCALAWLRRGPLPPGLLDGRTAASTLVVDRTGVSLYEALGEGGVRSVPMTAEHMPPVVAAATTAAEDHRFWSHPGVDPIAMARAAW